MQGEASPTFEFTPAWRVAYPGACIGVLAMHGVRNPEKSARLDRKKAALEEALRKQYASYDRNGLLSIPVLAAYRDYYKRFNKTYHVWHQLASVVFTNRSIPSVAALVEAMYMAELKNMLLTAGHDLGTIVKFLRVDVAKGTESYVRLNREVQVLKERDMFISDAKGAVSSILYGPDRRTLIRPKTRSVVFTVYAPPGIDDGDVRTHLEDIRDNVALFSPDASVGMMKTYIAN
jgi:DNA/RNA-binding domain of Phe-tRNA-synthetase-like protein